MAIVVDPPDFELGTGVLDRQELRDVQTLIPQSPVERLYMAVLCRLSGVNEVELHPALIGPLLERLRGELCAMVHRDRHRGACSFDGSIQGRDHVSARVCRYAGVNDSDNPMRTPGRLCELRGRAAWC